MNDTAETIIALERAALDSWCRGDPSGFLRISAPDVVYFDPFIPRRLDGLDALAAYYEGLRGTVSAAGWELLNPEVKVLGEAAVLTFNFVSWTSGGDRYRWNCTEVYHRRDAVWRIVQTHWSLTGGNG
jgi:ketosteroid isomerase-like protein